MTVDPEANRKKEWLQTLVNAVSTTPVQAPVGIVTSASGLTIEVHFPGLRRSDICSIEGTNPKRNLLCEVVSVRGKIAILSPFGDTTGLSTGDVVRRKKEGLSTTCGPRVLGAILNALGEVVSETRILQTPNKTCPIKGNPIADLERPLINEKIDTGLRVIDGLLSVGYGQRIGLFGPAGTGKSTFIAAMVNNSQFDVVVVGLIGERRREISEFVERKISPRIRAKTVVVAAPSDRPPMERYMAAHTAAAIAEDFAKDGKKVLLVIDSLTRVARALREVGLAAGEPPARRGFPATVYTLLPQIIERSGTSTKGSVTAIYAVLVEGEMADDPIAEEVQSLTDGHFILSRKLAVKNHFPAIDVLASLSRVMDDLVTDEHKASAGEARKLLAKYESLELLLSLGEYAPGASVENDRAVNLAPSLEQDYLKQSLSDRTEFDLAVKRLGEHVYG